MRTIEEKINDIELASKDWKSLIADKNIEPTDCILLFPEERNGETKYYIECIDELKAKRGYQIAHIVTFDRSFMEFNVLLDEECKIHLIERSMLERFILMYSLFDFSDRLYVCSLSIPDSRMGDRMRNGKYGCSLRDTVRIGIFRLG